MAWFTAGAGPVTNTFTAGTVEIELHDVTYDDLQALVPFPENGIQNVNPGDEYTKIVYVENTGSKAVYAVSYTHLDVYKRQTGPLPLGWQPGCKNKQKRENILDE